MNKRLLMRLLVIPFVIGLMLPYTIKYWMVSHKMTLLCYFLVTSLMSFGLIPLFYKLGLILDITDKPGGRHIHQQITPRTGGITIYIAFISALYMVAQPPPEFLGLSFASSIIALTGMLDDIRRLPATVKLLAQIMATAVLIKFGIVLSFFPKHLMGQILSIFLTYLWVLGITNAYNCLDGLDGLAGGIGMVILGFYSAIAYSLKDQFMTLVGIILFGAIAGFLPYNFRIKKRALVFLGDTGSTFIGFMLAALSIFGTWGTHKSVDLAIPILLLAVPITDMVMTTFTRIYDHKVKTLRQWMEYSGNDHFHHRLLALGLSSRTAVLTIWTFTLLMGLVALLIKTGNIFESLIALSIALIIFGLVMLGMVYEDLTQIRAENKKNVSKIE